MDLTLTEGVFLAGIGFLFVRIGLVRFALKLILRTGLRFGPMLLIALFGVVWLSLSASS